MSKNKKGKVLQVTLAVPTNLSPEELRELASSMKKRQERDASERLEDSGPEVASEETLEPEMESGFENPESEFEEPGCSDNAEELDGSEDLEDPEDPEGLKLEPNEDDWPGDEVFDDEVAEALVPTMLVDTYGTESVAIAMWCLLCRRIGEGDCKERYVVPLIVCSDGYQDLLRRRFEMKIDQKVLYRQRLAYRVNLSLKSLLGEITQYEIEPDYHIKDLGEFFRIFNERALAAIKEILAKHQKVLEVMPFASTSHYLLATAPLGNAMLVETAAKEYGDKVEQSLRLYALGDAPQNRDDPWKMKFSDARGLLDQRWLMSERFTEILLKGIDAEVLGKFFDGEEIPADELVGTALEGAKPVMLVPVIWSGESRDEITYGLAVESGWQLSGEMIQADLGDFTLWYCPGRSTDAIMTKNGGSEV